MSTPAKRLVVLAVVLGWTGCAAGPRAETAPAPAVESPKTARVSKEPTASGLAVPYEFKMISSGDNRPAVDLRAHLSDRLIPMLHEGRSVAAIRDALGWDDDEFQRHAAALHEAGLLQVRSDGTYAPGLMVVTPQDGRAIYQVVEPVAQELASLIVAASPQVKAAAQGMASTRGIPWANLSLLFLSNVLLDTGQINAVEARFLGVPRPSRADKQYYAAYLANDEPPPREAFGIYGNQMSPAGDMILGVYGNTRDLQVNLANLGQQHLEALFGLQAGEDADARRRAVVDAVAAGRGGEPTPRAFREGLTQLCILDAGVVTVPVFDADDAPRVEAIAALVTDDLIALLERHRSTFVEGYEGSGFAKEVTFAEYFIWTYHFLYSRVTDIVAERGAIKIPICGVSTYLARPPG